jgi:D-serine deaminase-like pyridoxal phosphate-dependent protein
VFGSISSNPGGDLKGRTMYVTSLATLLEERVDWKFKGFPETETEVTIGTIPAQRWHVFRGERFFPLLVLKSEALTHNLEMMARYCREHGVSLAPHGKTTMAPQIMFRQCEAGAWAITAATISQVRVFRAFGIRRILLANELVDAAALQWLARELARDPDFECYCFVDSSESVQAMTAGLGTVGAHPRRLKVLIEVGAPDTRAGCRTLEQMWVVADAVRHSPYLELAGVVGYEGAIEGQGREQTLEAIDNFLHHIRTWTQILAHEGAFAGTAELIVTAGGSAFFDRVVACLASPWDLEIPVRVVLRSGCYVTHDSGFYEQCSPLGSGKIGPGGFQPALELWSTVISRPQPELAILGFGKRDTSFDLGYPVPSLVREGNGGLRTVQGMMRVTRLDDQHAYVRLPKDAPLKVGDLVGCGISHPCTTLDKWPLIALVDADYQIIGGIRTFF